MRVSTAHDLSNVYNTHSVGVKGRLTNAQSPWGNLPTAHPRGASGFGLLLFIPGNLPGARRMALVAAVRVGDTTVLRAVDSHR